LIHDKKHIINWWLKAQNLENARKVQIRFVFQTYIVFSIVMKKDPIALGDRKNEI
jgi:hypothetical protein